MLKGKTGREYQSFIGLEIHIQLLTQTKVFCRCPNVFGAEPNTHICPVCLGYPGVLPSLNEEAVKKSYQVALALGCVLNKKAVFERKNYYYPDMTKNYQISQFESPIGINGFLDLELKDGKTKRIRFHDVHLEEDAGKMIHRGLQSFLDYNRAGTPLLEIVTEPDLETGEEAELLLQQFQRMIRYLGVSDGNMEEGSMRADANVSVNEKGLGLGVKAEVKNLNSSRHVRLALEYEIQRHLNLLESGKTVVQETRLWDEGKAGTHPMRSKESAQDYRYFPEPDLPPFAPSPEFLSARRESMAELPGARKARMKARYGLNETQAAFICDDKAGADFFEAAAALGAPPQALFNWLSTEVQRHFNKNNLRPGDPPLTPRRLASLVDLVEKGRVPPSLAKQILEQVFQTGRDPEDIVAEQSLEPVEDREVLEKLIKEIFAAHPKVAEALKNGDSRQAGFVMGRVMKATGGRAHPQLAQEIIRELSLKP